MATFYSNSYGGRQLRLVVTQDGGYAKWTLYSEGGSTGLYSIYNLSVKINSVDCYSPGTVAWTANTFPAATGSKSGSVWIGNGASDKTVYVHFVGEVFYNKSDQHGGNFTMSAYIFKPSLSEISYSNVADTSASVSFTVQNNNGEAPTSTGIEASLSNFGSVVKSINSKSGTLTGLTPNRTYYIRGKATNSAGTSYTGVKSFTTTFSNPGSPGAPILTYDQTEPIPKAILKATWTAASAGSTAVAGYRLRLFKNNVEVAMIDTDSTAVTYTFGSFESLGFEVGDVAKVGIYAYCYDWNDEKHFNGGGVSTAQVFSSNTVSVISDKYIYVSQNGGSFTKYKMYISQNGGAFVEVKKEKFKVI